MKRVFIDVNVLLEVLLNRNLAEQCITLLGDDLHQYVISALTVHIVWYIAERYKLNTTTVDDLLSPWELLPITSDTLAITRMRYKGKDFEDCIQASCAEEGGCDEIITIDKHFKTYSGTQIPVTVIS